MDYLVGTVYENEANKKQYIVLARKNINGQEYLLSAPYAKNEKGEDDIMVEYAFVSRYNKESKIIIPDPNEDVIRELINDIYK